MVIKIKLMYNYLFFFWNSIFKHSYDSYNNFKSGAILTVLELLLVMRTLLVFVPDIFDDRYNFIAIIFSLIIATTNYFVFSYNDNYKVYEKNFLAFSKKQRLRYNLLATFIFIICILYLIF